ncbi:DinB family protein [Mucilaginibacter sp. AK015]|uniref:DinB family protein n=1 Tax=Mucilaginibacter sp. AK015 TaxID=2723072 RepID=UPI00160CE09D|nr:DinB family protein [Mucilaginibacter sp. AK015]MBB5395165.1 putative damage-inducible protein DinB [Mucilaginibacter sp. AK015]
MLTEILTKLYRRDLLKLRQELNAYRTEANIWRTEGQIANSAGNLTLHLIGNLNHYIGAVLGKSGYVRDRPAEFALKDIPRDQLVHRIDETIAVIEKTMGSLTNDDLTAEFPEAIAEGRVSTGYFLVHLATHLGYHLGQVNYHRRLLDS